MLITARSVLSGKVSSMDLPVTQEQIWAWRAGELIQNVFPDLTADQREFLMTGITPDEWENAFGKE